MFVCLYVCISHASTKSSLKESWFRFTFVDSTCGFKQHGTNIIGVYCIKQTEMPTIGVEILKAGQMKEDKYSLASFSFFLLLLYIYQLSIQKVIAGHYHSAPVRSGHRYPTAQCKCQNVDGWVAVLAINIRSCSHMPAGGNVPWFQPSMHCINSVVSFRVWKVKPI